MLVYKEIVAFKVNMKNEKKTCSLLLKLALQIKVTMNIMFHSEFNKSTFTSEL